MTVAEVLAKAGLLPQTAEYLCASKAVMRKSRFLQLDDNVPGGETINVCHWGQYLQIQKQYVVPQEQETLL